LFAFHAVSLVGEFVDGVSPMIDPDVTVLVLFLALVVIALLAPPGPGTPLRSPIPSR